MGEQIPIPEPEDETMNYLSVESSGRFKKIKKAAKVTAIMLLYVFLFFRPFLSNSLDILFIRSLYSAMNVNIVEPSQNLISSPLVSTSTVIASDPTSFLLDEASDGFQ